ncbi:unnamed protein product [Scytosiphon promiscuus]
MGNAEPSWHQRRPYGFSKGGYGKAQLKLQAYRRPSTASGRLSSAPTALHQQSSPRALVADRSEYWGNHGRRHSNNDDESIGAGTTPRNNSLKRPQGAQGLRARGRPSSAGYYRASPPGAASPAVSVVEACTRNHAGIVRGGGRDGRAAPPPTPPPRDCSSQGFERTRRPCHRSTTYTTVVRRRRERRGAVSPLLATISVIPVSDRTVSAIFHRGEVTGSLVLVVVAGAGLLSLRYPTGVEQAALRRERGGVPPKKVESLKRKGRRRSKPPPPP